MKSSYGLPSGSYNLILTKEDLVKLLSEGILSIRLSRVPCVTSRAVWNPETKNMDVLDKKLVDNDLRFHLYVPVADIEDGFHNVQFLNIRLEKEDIP